MESLDDLVKLYFKRCYSYREILYTLRHVHNISTSIRTLHRTHRRLNLYRKGHVSDTKDLIEFVREELNGSGSCVSYRQMHHRCVNNGLRVNRSSVAAAMSVIDPEGVECRRRKYLRRRMYFSRGPNWVWHIDGYDKLKPYGFSIHSAIDGFSRKIIWLAISRSNKEPRFVCSLYLNHVSQVNRVPRMVVADLGTQNIYVAAAQRFLRRKHTDSSSAFNSFKYGKSTSNQRIEALWSHLRRGCTNWWMNYFKDLIEVEKYNSASPIQRECLFFYDGLNSDLKEFKQSWNGHRSDVLYHTPSFSDPSIQTYEQNVDYNDLNLLQTTFQYETVTKHICTVEFFELASILMVENSLVPAKNAEEALCLHETLLRLIDAV
ncbi:uncharacterized protein LOC130646002 [Hydractinia symbiolongicarpus]|uniref:uncharacterized protein LOC130646002 n=1 Tax=Hydractinia symbiolongicarpus TaxID=13093 RepID=UPI00254B57D2|nr:uncharacterized protein LOC130646002 [Hydractinia symbiolongicarpus]